MRVFILYGLLLVLLSAASTSLAWQQQPAGSFQGAVPAPVVNPREPSGAPGAQMYGGQPGYPANSVPQRYTDGQAVNADDYPYYPYPQYRNPYYDGSSGASLLNEGIDWVIGLPSVVANGFSDLMNRGWFPRRPATHGGAPQAPAPEPVSTPPAPNTGTSPLPGLPLGKGLPKPTGMP